MIGFGLRNTKNDIYPDGPSPSPTPDPVIPTPDKIIAHPLFYPIMIGVISVLILILACCFYCKKRKVEN